MPASDPKPEAIHVDSVADERAPEQMELKDTLSQDPNDPQVGFPQVWHRPG